MVTVNINREQQPPSRFHKFLGKSIRISSEKKGFPLNNSVASPRRYKETTIKQTSSARTVSPLNALVAKKTTPVTPKQRVVIKVHSLISCNESNRILQTAR